MWQLHINGIAFGLYDSLNAAIRAFALMDEYQMQHISIKYRDRTRKKQCQK